MIHGVKNQLRRYFSSLRSYPLPSIGVPIMTKWNYCYFNQLSHGLPRNLESADTNTSALLHMIMMKLWRQRHINRMIPAVEIVLISTLVSRYLWLSTIWQSRDFARTQNQQLLFFQHNKLLKFINLYFFSLWNIMKFSIVRIPAFGLPEVPVTREWMMGN